MNKAEQREVQKLVKWVRAGLCGPDMVARVLSALVRASRTSRSRVALLQVADEMGVKGHPEFIARI
jgi:hypothetical protein